MKAHTQILMIALAITFAVALALTVALLCFSYLREESAQNLPKETPEESLEVYNPLLSQTKEPAKSTTAPATSAPPAATTAPAAPQKSLLFAPNGDGTSRVIGIGSYTDPCVVIPEYDPNGNRVTTVASGALYGCVSVTAIQIPASVVHIEPLAFANCKNLLYVSVSPKNVAYRDVDGVLYSYDKKTLILYPSMRVGSTAEIPASVTAIAEMAFYNCVYLRSITYGGTAEQWEQIRIDSKNYSLTAASKTFGNGK